MKLYKIFLGSSIQPPVSYDRNAIGNFIRKINDALRADDRNVYVELFLCEQEDTSINPAREKQKQEEYDRYIREEANLFLNLYHENAGQFTVRELNVAKQTARLGAENIQVWFLDCPQSSKGIAQLQGDLKAEGFPFYSYAHVDQVKVAVLRWLEKQEPGLPVIHQADAVRLGNHILLSKR